MFSSFFSHDSESYDSWDSILFCDGGSKYWSTESLCHCPLSIKHFTDLLTGFLCNLTFHNLAGWENNSITISVFSRDDDSHDVGLVVLIVLSNVLAISEREEIKTEYANFLILESRGIFWTSCRVYFFNPPKMTHLTEHCALHTARDSGTQSGPELWVYRSALQHVAVVLSPDQNYGCITVPLQHLAVVLSPGHAELWVHRSALQHVALVLSQDHAEHYGFITVPLQHVAVEHSPDQNYGFGTHICRWKSLYPASDLFLAEQLLGCMAWVAWNCLWWPRYRMYSFKQDHNTA